jgi:TetR/AcrR family transcriptional repressor of lmrAB and yxaGH operons
MMVVIEVEDQDDEDVPTLHHEGPDVRTRMVQAAATLIGARGVSASSFADVLEASGASRGSIYHYFAGGKRQLVAEAIEWTSEQVQAHQRGCDATTPSGVIEHFVDLWRQIVTSSGAHAGCPLAALASDPYADEPQLAAAVKRGFEAWTALLTDQLGCAGMNGSDALAIATTTVAAMEGALILCRARGNVAPLDAIATQLDKLVTTRT